MKQRRPRGEGGIAYRAHDGRWEGTFTIGYNAQGRRVRKTVYGKTPDEVWRKLEEVKAVHTASTLHPRKKRADLRRICPRVARRCQPICNREPYIWWRSALVHGWPFLANIANGRH